MTAPTAPKPQPYTDHPTDRAAIAAGYRHIADLVESGQAPIPMNIHISFPINRDKQGDQAAVAAELRRALGGGVWEKNESTSGSYLYLTGMCGGLPVQLWLARDAVCERRVVGEEEVEIPALPAQPARVEVREVVEWICSPLLADSPEQVTA